MAIFLYTALDAHGATHQGEIQASDRRAALEAVVKQGLAIVSLKEKGNIKRTLVSRFTPFSRISALDRILLTRHLSSIIHAGVPLGEAIDILIFNNQKRSLLRKILEEAKRNLQEGHPLSSVFALYPEHFPAIFVGLIRAGEVSGTLEETLKNLGDQLLRDYELTRKVRSAMVYPAILLGASISIIILILTFVLPRLAASFGQANIKLPLLTMIIIGTSSLLSSHKFFTIAISIIFFGFWGWFLRKPVGKRFVFIMVSHLPIAKNLFQRLALARFARTLKNLIKSGVSLMEALEIVSVSVGNESYRKEFLHMREELRKGISFADAFRKREEFFPRLVGSLITVGERTGSLENSLETIADFYDEEVDRTLRTLVTLLEPLLLLVMGLIVGGIAVSVLLPIYQLIGQVR